jgi:hypothetical protein
MDMNAPINPVELTLLDQLIPMQNKHIFTKNYGDGEIVILTRHNDLQGVWVYFYTNAEGGYEEKIDGAEFLREVEKIRPFD